ncbi:hypothetical protein [Melittangium boletus]|uniref:Uncharacterized protein n=1 Tax=Melittangium boletus DSM 14713 TaxID=1294270 RepID=A0A250IRT2_9BACT|nr:hypothetical protein [Melittangium boletus]ATB33646.1 hypothetical protein MEBOL_007144 [Melittangium boletus DSM 14713]
MAYRSEIPGLESPEPTASGLEEVLDFPLVQALLGRRSRRFFLGASIPDGPMAFTSSARPVPLSSLEQMLLITAVGGNTGWHYLIARNAHYAPALANYAGTAGGRTFPSAAGFHTSELFFTDDTGIYFVATRDAPALGERDADGRLDLKALLAAHRSRVRKISDQRLILPPRAPHMEGHNTWVSNQPGTTLFIPVADLAQHHLATLCYLVQNGFCITDDYHHRPIPGMERFRELVDVDHPYPLSYVEQLTLGEATVELSTACYAGTLMLQAMGLGGWMYDGLDRNSVLGASGEPDAPGLGFRYDTDPRWTLPNPTGLPGVFEGFCPPHYPDMRAAVEAFCQRKFGRGGPFHPDTPGPYKDTRRIRGSARVHDEEFKACVTRMAQYLHDTFGKFPATLPSTYCLMYLQAHHLDLAFYDHFYQQGAYLKTHAQHMEKWHPEH